MEKVKPVCTSAKVWLPTNQIKLCRINEIFTQQVVNWFNQAPKSKGPMPLCPLANKHFFFYPTKELVSARQGLVKVEKGWEMRNSTKVLSDQKSRPAAHTSVSGALQCYFCQTALGPNSPPLADITEDVSSGNRKKLALALKHDTQTTTLSFEILLNAAYKISIHTAPCLLHLKSCTNVSELHTHINILFII